MPNIVPVGRIWRESISRLIYARRLPNTCFCTHTWLAKNCWHQRLPVGWSRNGTFFIAGLTNNCTIARANVRLCQVRRWKYLIYSECRGNNGRKQFSIIRLEVCWMVCLVAGVTCLIGASAVALVYSKEMEWTVEQPNWCSGRDVWFVLCHLCGRLIAQRLIV